MYNILQISALKQFQCLGDACEDTCCKNWGMQIGAITIAKYALDAPELLAAVDGDIMKRDECSDFCSKYELGLCAIHRDYGEDFLGDACNFFPRATRKMGAHTLMSAALSCPEIVRLSIINTPTSPYYVSAQTPRLPDSITDYALSDMNDDDALTIHMALVQHALADSITAEQALMHLQVVLDALAMQPVENWAAATPMYLKMADGRIETPHSHIADGFNLVNILAMLVKLTTNQINPRLTETIDKIMQALHISFDDSAGTLILSDNSAEIWQNASAKWIGDWQHNMQPILKKWLAAELALNFFPFGGLGDDFAERTTIIAMRYATMRLAIIAHLINHNAPPDEAQLVLIIQSLARFLDHLGDSTTLLDFCNHAGWNSPARLNGLLQM